MIRKTVIAFFISIFIFVPLFLGLNTQTAFADFDCLTLNIASSPTDKAYCQDQLSQIEAQLNALLAQQAAQKQQTGTLKGDVDYLNSQINALKVKIKAQALVIAQLKVAITDKTNTITSLSDKIDREHESLAQLLRNTNEFDNENIIHLILSDSTISNFYSDLESYDSIKQAVKSSVDVINGVKTQTEVAKTALVKQQNAVTDAKAQLESAQKTVTKVEADKQQLLAISKQKESAYAALAAQKKAQADKIRGALFSLAGVSTKIDFGTALGFANQVQAKFGTDPAFILAIMTQESNLGSNTGQCYLTNPDSGAGVNINTGKNWPNLMNPTRDVPPFLNITSDFQFNAYHTAVSCPIASAGGYGGAMGPAQFIPSTWQGFAPRLKNLLGYEANPWSPLDAFMASGMYLSDLGAVGSSQSGQNKAACSYYGTRGSSCSYSRQVQKLKNSIQANINLL